MTILVSSTLMVVLLMTWWRLTRGTAQGTLLACLLLMLAATILALVAEIGRLTASIS